MSQENVDKCAGASRPTRGASRRGARHLDPDVVYKPIQEAAVRGRDAVRASLERWEAEWDELERTPRRSSTQAIT